MDNLIGLRFGELEIVELLDVCISKKAYKIKCICDCGSFLETTLSKLKKGDKRSCGCYFDGFRIKHKEEYVVWGGMKTRCNNVNAENYSRYGGKGISYCQGLDSFKHFYSVVGKRPTKKHQLDRINGHLNYACGVCEECIKSNNQLNLRWVTARENVLNKTSIKKIDVFGEKLTIREASNKYGIPRTTISSRVLFYNWSPERAVTTKSKKHENDRQK